MFELFRGLENYFSNVGSITTRKDKIKAATDCERQDGVARVTMWRLVREMKD